MFEQPIYLALLILIPIFIVFLIWRGMARASVIRRIGDQELVKSLTSQISPLRRQVKSGLWLVALVMVIVALARPTWGSEEDIIRTEGVQIIFAVDVSRSMDADDIAPSRLTRARLDILDVMTALDGNDIGLVIFAREAFSYMPLTYDLVAAEIFLDGISTDMITQQGTNIPDAVERALGSFEARSDAQKAIILITDGESHEGDALVAAQQAAEENVIVYSVGYGTENGANIPIYNETGDLVGFQTTSGETSDGTLVTTTLNVDLLQRIANTTGGFYISGGSDLTPLIADIQTLESGDIGERVIIRPIERFWIFVAIALMALSFEILLPETKPEGV